MCKFFMCRPGSAFVQHVQKQRTAPCSYALQAVHSRRSDIRYVQMPVHPLYHLVHRYVHTAGIRYWHIYKSIARRQEQSIHGTRANTD